MVNLKLKFRKDQLKKYADKYEYQSYDHIIKIGLLAKEKKYLTHKQLVAICEWKTPRSKPKVASNNQNFVREVTHISFTTKSDKLRIEILTLLNGVGWPTASTILHFCHKLKFPILDFRALYSVGIDPRPTRYEYSLWMEYTNFCRELSKELKLDLRTIDRGLWQYSKDNSN